MALGSNSSLAVTSWVTSDSSWPLRTPTSSSVPGNHSLTSLVGRLAHGTESLKDNNCLNNFCPITSLPEVSRES